MRTAWVVAATVSCAAAFDLACVSDQFQCRSAGECVLASGTAGRCEATGFCSFPEAPTACPSGFRYGHHSASDLADRCVEANPSDGSPGDGPNPDGPFMEEDLVSGGTFDTDCSGIAAVFGTSITHVTEGRDGGGACELCDTGSFNVISATFSDVETPAAGSKYKLEIWARASSRTAGNIVFDVGIDQICESSVSATGFLSTTWQRLDDTMIAACQTPGIGPLTISATGSQPGTCIEVDSLRLVSVP